MPQVGWLYRGKKYSHEDAVKIAKEKGFFAGFPPAALRRMKRDDRNPYIFSPSAAGYCLRQKILRTEHDYYEKPMRVWKMSRGTAIHGYLDEEIEGQSEKRLSLDLTFKDKEGNEYTITMQGTLDYYEPETQSLYDYKTTGTFTYNINGKNYPKEYPTPEHELQTNLYRYLMEKHGLPVKRIFIWYVSAGDGTKPIECPVWSMEETEEVVYNLASHLVGPKFKRELPPAYPVGSPEYKRECENSTGKCPVFDVCREKEEKGE